MKNLRSLSFTILLVAVFGLFVSCNEGDEPNADLPKTITELASASPEFSSLVSALQNAGLDEVLNGTDQYTVFAPTNDAFSDFLSANGYSNLEEVPTSTLTDLLLNHVISGTVKSTSLMSGYVPTLSKEKTTDNVINLYVDLTTGVRINGISTVTTANIEASNGVIHKVDKVISMPSVVTHALANPDFSILVAALTRSDLTTNFVEVLSGNGPFTVFAPNNDAFAALLASSPDWNDLSDIPTEVLESVLKYHVISGANVLSTTLQNNQEVGTLNGQSIKISLAQSGASIIDANDRSSNIIAVDVQAVNGVIHAIDKVILPEI